MDWQPTRLADIARIAHGYAFKGEYFCEDVSEDALVTPGNFAIGGGFQAGSPKFYRGPVDDRYALKPGDLVVTMTDLSRASDTLGYAAVVPAGLPYRLLHNQRIGLVTVHAPERVDVGFLHWYMRTPGYRHRIVATASGSAVRHTSPSRILDSIVNLPPLAEQRRIAAALGALDDRIALNRRLNRDLEALAHALFRARFVTFEGRADLVNAGPGHDALPRGWTTEPLDGVADFLNGVAAQKHPAREGEPSLPVIKIRELNSGITNATDRATARVAEKYVVGDGDLLFSWSGSLVVKRWTGGPGLLNQHLFKVTSRRYPLWFYFLWLLHHLGEFQRIATSKATTMGHIQRHHLTRARVVVPPADELSALTAVFEPIVEQQLALDLQSNKLAALRDALLPKLVAGEVHVPEALDGLLA